VRAHWHGKGSKAIAIMAFSHVHIG
jgi:hypothetical protein